MKGDLQSEAVEGVEYFFDAQFIDAGKKSKLNVQLLPAYDELIISYRDRTASLVSEHHKRAISENGLFRPVIVVDGKAVGIWKRTVKGERLIIEAELFARSTKQTRAEIESAADGFADFLGKKAEVIFAERD